MYRLELSRVVKGVDENVLYFFGHIERMDNEKIAKRVYVEECMGSHLVG